MARSHHIFAAESFRVPAPFRTFAVRSEEPAHAFEARAPYGSVHLVRTTFLSADALAQLSGQGYARVDIDAFGDVDYAATSWHELAAATPDMTDLPRQIGEALSLTGVLGAGATACHEALAGRVDYLASRGAGFHNDVRGRWSRCLFWVLALDLAHVEFVMPHAGVRLPLGVGDLLVFDQTMAHGLCRPTDQGQVIEASFGPGDDSRQLFLTGELPLSDARWAALDAPWLPVEEHERRGALDLMVAEFDECSGAIKRPGELRDSMKRSTCYVDAGAG